MEQSKGKNIINESQQLRDKYLEIVTNSLLDGDPIFYISVALNNPLKVAMGEDSYIVQAFMNGNRKMIGDSMVFIANTSKDIAELIAYVAALLLLDNKDFLTRIIQIQNEIKRQ